MAIMMRVFSLSNLKYQLNIMQTMSIPELIVGFFKAIFYAFYYSGYGVFGIIRYLLINVLMTLMRGTTEEVIEEPPIQENQFMVTALTDTPSDELLSAAAMIQSALLTSDANKDENELSTPSNVASVDRLGEGVTEDGSAEQTEQQTVESELPMTLVSVSLFFLTNPNFSISIFDIQLLAGGFIGRRGCKTS